MKGSDRKIVGIGACVMDTLLELPSYPKEDTKMQARRIRIQGGGPAATGIVAAARLGVPSGFIGILADDESGRFLRADFEKYGVDTGHIRMEPGKRGYSSVIWLAGDSKSRTCVFEKGNLPPLALNDEMKRSVAQAGILMIDGNELEAAYTACLAAKEAGTLILYDCGGQYEGIEKLLAQTDIMIPSEEFALAVSGCGDAAAAARKLFGRFSPQVVVVTCGKEGGILYDGKEFWRYPAFPVDAADTNGSGDVFHGAFAAGLAKGLDWRSCCFFASAAAALKCRGLGARESAPDETKVWRFLRERHADMPQIH